MTLSTSLPVHLRMSHVCYNLTWIAKFHPMGRTYLGLGVLAFLFHVLFWVQVATHRSLRQLSMLWVYNYLFTDMLLLIQLFLEYILRTSLPYCVSPPILTIFCNLEAYTTAWVTVLEAYMLLCLNITRYYLIVKNCNIAARYPYSLILFSMLLYPCGIIVFLVQVKLLKTVTIHLHQTSSNCHLQYDGTKTQIGSLITILIIPIALNCYFMTVTTIHVRRSQQAARAQRSKHWQLLVQFFVLYILWLILWAPNAMVSHMLTNNAITIYTRVGSIISALCGPLIFMFIDRRFLKVWKNTIYHLIRCGRSFRQIRPSSISNELRLAPSMK